MSMGVRRFGTDHALWTGSHWEANPADTETDFSQYAPPRYQVNEVATFAWSVPQEMTGIIVKRDLWVNFGETYREYRLVPTITPDITYTVNANRHSQWEKLVGIAGGYRRIGSRGTAG